MFRLTFTDGRLLVSLVGGVLPTEGVCGSLIRSHEGSVDDRGARTRLSKSDLGDDVGIIQHGSAAVARAILDIGGFALDIGTWAWFLASGFAGLLMDRGFGEGGRGSNGTRRRSWLSTHFDD